MQVCKALLDWLGKVRLLRLGLNTMNTLRIIYFSKYRKKISDKNFIGYFIHNTKKTSYRMKAPTVINEKERLFFSRLMPLVD